MAGGKLAAGSRSFSACCSLYSGWGTLSVTAEPAATGSGVRAHTWKKINTPLFSAQFRHHNQRIHGFGDWFLSPARRRNSCVSPVEIEAERMSAVAPPLTPSTAWNLCNANELAVTVTLSPRPATMGDNRSKWWLLDGCPATPLNFFGRSALLRIQTHALQDPGVDSSTCEHKYVPVFTQYMHTTPCSRSIPSKIRRLGSV